MQYQGTAARKKSAKAPHAAMYVSFLYYALIERRVVRGIPATKIANAGYALGPPALAREGGFPKMFRGSTFGKDKQGAEDKDDEADCAEDP